jgi:RES domain-containing protein
LIYAAQTYSGALLEQLAHGNIGRLPATQVYIEIDIPEDAPVERARPDEIPGWNAADMTASRARGDAWYYARASAVLFVPAAVTGGIESNVLISQEHANFGFLRASEPRPVIWDPRLFRT